MRRPSNYEVAPGIVVTVAKDEDGSVGVSKITLRGGITVQPMALAEAVVMPAAQGRLKKAFRA